MTNILKHSKIKGMIFLMEPREYRFWLNLESTLYGHFRKHVLNLVMAGPDFSALEAGAVKELGPFQVRNWRL